MTSRSWTFGDLFREHTVPRIIQGGLRKMDAHASKNLPESPPTSEEIEVITFCFAFFAGYLSDILDDLHEKIVEHSEMTLTQSISNLDLYQIVSEDWRIMNDKVWILEGNKWETSHPISSETALELLTSAANSVGQLFRRLQTLEENLLLADQGTYSLQIADRACNLAYTHNALSRFLYQCVPLRQVFFFVIPEKDIPRIVSGAFQPPKLCSDVSSAVPMSPTATSSPFAQELVPEEATCFVCWGSSQPDYDDEDVSQDLQEQGISDLVRPLPDAHQDADDTPLISAGCCTALLHKVCLFQALFLQGQQNQPKCAHCQQDLKEAFVIALIDWKLAQLSRKTLSIQAVLLEEHKTFRADLNSLPIPLEPSTAGMEPVEG